MEVATHIDTCLNAEKKNGGNNFEKLFKYKNETDKMSANMA